MIFTLQVKKFKHITFYCIPLIINNLNIPNSLLEVLIGSASFAVAKFTEVFLEQLQVDYLYFTRLYCPYI